MAESGGQFVVKITGDSAQLRNELAKANAAAASSAAKLESVYTSAGVKLRAAFAGLAAGISVGALSRLVKGSIDAADRLNDLSQATGITVETLGGIGFAAKQSGTDLESVSKALGKLNLEIAAAAAGDVKAAQAFTALGISLDSLKSASTDEVLARIADRFAGFEGGANKAAIANQFFKKNYQELIPLLNQGGDELRKQIEYFRKYSGVTADTAARADQFNDTLAKIHLLLGAFGNTLAAALLPTLQKLADLFVDAKEKGEGFKGVAQGIADVFNILARAGLVVVYGFQQVGHEIAAVAAQVNALAHLDFKGIDAIVDAKAQASKERTDALLKNLQALADVGQGKVEQKTPRALVRAPTLPTSDTQDVAKKILEGKLRALQNVVSEERDLLQSRLHFLQDYYQSDEISISDYFNRRREVTQAALEETQRAYDQEIALLRERQKKADPKEREEIENRIADVVAKRTKAQRESAIASVDSFREESKAADEFTKKIKDLSIQLAEMRGDKVTAGLARFDLENEQIKKQLDLERQLGDERSRQQADAGLRDLGARREILAQQLQMNKAQEDFSLILGDVDIAQQRVAIALSSGALTELEALQKTSDINRARIDELRQVAAGYEAVARASGDPRALQAAEQLKVKIEELAAATDLVAKKFNDVFVDSFSDALTSLATGAKSFKDILKDLEKSIVSGISRIASQNIAETLFKPENLGGVGGFFSQLFGGGKSKDVGGSALATAGGTLTTAGTTMTTAATTLLTASTTLQAAATSLAASSGASGFGNLFGGGGFSDPGIASDTFSFFGFANGGSPPVGVPSLVGERGPELFVPKQSGVIIPNDVLMAKRAAKTVNQTVNITVQGSVSTKTANQMAVEIGRHTRRAMARDS